MLQRPRLYAMMSQQRDKGCPVSKSPSNVATNASFFAPNSKDGSDVSCYIPGFIAGQWLQEVAVWLKTSC